MSAPEPIPLPGMESAADHNSTPLEAAIRRTIAALDGAARLGEKDAARLQLAIELGGVIDAKKRTGRMSTIGMDAKVLVDLLEGIVGDAGSVDDELRKALREWGKDDESATAD